MNKRRGVKPLYSPGEREFLSAEIGRELGSVVATFTIQRVPRGGAPESIRRGWLGVNLPVRAVLLEELGGAQQYTDHLTGEKRVNPDTIPVFGLDAVLALDALGRDVAAGYWQNFALAKLLFQGSEGELSHVGER